MHKIIGVSYNKKRWYVHIGIRNKHVSLGGFDNFDEAVCIRLAAEQCLDMRYHSISNNSAYVYVQENILGIKVDKNINQKYLQQLFTYENGSLYWKVYTTNNCKSYKNSKNIKAGAFNKTNGRWYVNLHGKNYPNYVLVWVFHKGAFPTYEIDHIDRDKTNDCIENLRDIQRGYNHVNKISSKSITGIRGVSVNKSGTIYTTVIKKNKKTHYMYTGKDFETAVLYRLAAEQAFCYDKILKYSDAFDYVCNNIVSTIK
jgi:hypothetical protein